MVAGTIRYSVGNENNPSDPWGRSELVIAPDGSARLDHHFSRVRRVGAWRGQVDPDPLAAVGAGLGRAGVWSMLRQTADAAIIAAIVVVSTALIFFQEYVPERAVLDAVEELRGLSENLPAEAARAVSPACDISMGTR